MAADRSAARSPLAFFALVFALSLPFWTLGAVARTALPLPANLGLTSLQVVAPLLAALIMVYREKGLAGIGVLLRKAVDFKSVRPRLWYLPALSLPPLIYLLSYVAMRLLRMPLPEARISAASVLVFFFVFFVAAAAEEVGWSGYAADPAQARWGALKAGLLIGLVWALWHVVADVQAKQAPSWIAWHRLSSIAERVLIVWLYNNSGRSVFAAILFHDMDSVSVFSFPNDGSHYNPAVTAPITVTVAATVVFLWGAKTLARFRYAGRR